MAEVWILGATGRSGSAVAQRLAAQGVPLTLVGRNEERLRAVVPDAGVLVADTVDRMVAEIARAKPKVVVNFLGDYAESGPRIARACLPGGHYVDLAADLAGTSAILDLNDEAANAGSTLITGAGFGVLATEAAVARLCEGHPTPHHVQVDSVASVAVEAGVLGTALAASIVDGLATGARRYRNGELIKTRTGSNLRTHTFPDGETAKSAAGPAGELVAAQRISKAPNVDATTALVPTSLPARIFMPLAGALMSIAAVRRFAVRRMAAIHFKATPQPRRHSWGHATATWPDGTVRELWLQADDASTFTTGVAVAVVSRLLAGSAPGAFTPAAAFGPGLAELAGATFL